MKSQLLDDNIEIYSIRNERKSVAAESFIRTLKNKIYGYMTSISKNVYIGKLDDIVNKYTNTYHRTIKMKSVDGNPACIFPLIKKNKEASKFKVGDNVRISKYKNIFRKVYVSRLTKLL